MTVSLLWLPGDSQLRLAQSGRREPARALSPRGGVYGIIGLVAGSALCLMLSRNESPAFSAQNDSCSSFTEKCSSEPSAESESVSVRDALFAVPHPCPLTPLPASRWADPCCSVSMGKAPPFRWLCEALGELC